MVVGSGNQGTSMGTGSFALGGRAAKSLRSDVLGR